MLYIALNEALESTDGIPEMDVGGKGMFVETVSVPDLSLTMTLLTHPGTVITSRLNEAQNGGAVSNLI